MPDFEQQLNAILSDPNAMSQIMGLAQSLQSGNAPPPPQPAPAPPSPDLSGLLKNFDVPMMQRLLPLLGELNNRGGSEQRLQTLQSLAPFLKQERREKISQAVKTAHLIYLGKKLLLTGDRHV